MKIGIISEGHSDRAVITNILGGIAGIDSSDIEPLLPIYTKDATDKALVDPRAFSTWSAVKKQCETRELIDSFLAIEGQDFVVIHLDTAEADLFPINRPIKNENYAENLREVVIQKINQWLQIDLSKSILYAVAIEEIDAWILAILEDRDSTKTVGAKEKLKHVLSKKKINSTTTYENYLVISKPLNKRKKIEKGGYLNYNSSLKAFCEEIVEKVLPKVVN